MEGLTYEKDDRKKALETFEWDNLWCEHADDSTKKRILIIGDSISFGYRHIINAELEGEVYVDNYATSKAVDNKFFLECIDMFKKQNFPYSMVQVNNGLHGWHLSEDEYKIYYKKFICGLIEMFPKISVVIALSTPVREMDNLEEFAERNERVINRNIKAKEIAEELGLETVDLYDVVSDHPELMCKDGVHIQDEGYKLISKKIAEYVRRTLNRE